MIRYLEVPGNLFGLEIANKQALLLFRHFNAPTIPALGFKHTVQVEEAEYGALFLPSGNPLSLEIFTHNSCILPTRNIAHGDYKCTRKLHSPGSTLFSAQH